MRLFIKHLKLLKIYIIVGWKNGTEYRKDFFISIIDFFVSILITIVFWSFIFDDLIIFEGWGKEELVILALIGNTSWALSEFFAGTWSLPEKIVSGQIDKYLCRPINSLFATIMESSQFDEVLKGFIGLLILMNATMIIYGTYSINIVSILLGILSLLIGVVIISLMRVTISSLSFWLGETSSLNMILHLEDFSFERYPLDIFGKYSFIFIYFIPIGFISTIPTKIILGGTPIYKALFFEMLIFIIWLVIATLVWKYGLKKYESYGG